MSEDWTARKYVMRRNLQVELSEYLNSLCGSPATAGSMADEGGVDIHLEWPMVRKLVRFLRMKAPLPPPREEKSDARE